MTPNERYPLLDAIENCPKCGENFYGEPSIYGPLKPPSLRYGCKSSTDDRGVYTVHDEWIKRECPTCSFAWRENVSSDDLPSDRG